MEILSATTNIYNSVIASHYNGLLNFAKQDQDNVHTSYLKVLKRITDKPFTATTITELKKKLNIYVKTTIYNNYKTNYALKKQALEIGWEAEKSLQVSHADNIVEIEEMNQMRFEVEKLFQYLKSRYSEANLYVFRVYYLYDTRGKKITYAKLSKITGFSISKCCGIIQTIKTDLKNNLIQYIENE